MKSLNEHFLELNEAHFAKELPPPELSWNTRLSSTAGRFCPGSRNPLRWRPPLIEVAGYLRELSDGEMHIADTMLHEMIHYYLWLQGRPYGHTDEFRRIMLRVGAKRFNPVPKTRPFKHWYECPGCHKRVPARRRMANSACLACCEQAAGGRYDRRFRLELVATDGQSLGHHVETAEDDEIGWEPIDPCGIETPALPPPEPCLPPNEIIRRLEELKQMLLRKTASRA